MPAFNDGDSLWIDCQERSVWQPTLADFDDYRCRIASGEEKSFAGELSWFYEVLIQCGTTAHPYAMTRVYNVAERFLSDSAPLSKLIDDGPECRCDIRTGPCVCRRIAWEKARGG